MKPVAVLLLLACALPSLASEAGDMFVRAIYSTEPTEQVDLYTRALNLDPDLPMAHHNLGAAYYRLGMFERAAQVLEMALMANDRYANTYYLLACCYARLGRSDDAMTSVKKAVRYGWVEGLMLRDDTDLDAIRALDGFPRLSTTGESSSGARHGRRSRRGSKKPGSAGPSTDPSAAPSAAPVAAPPEQPPVPGAQEPPPGIPPVAPATPAAPPVISPITPQEPPPPPKKIKGKGK